VVKPLLGTAAGLVAQPLLPGAAGPALIIATHGGAAVAGNR
jgi:hypothetical protein